MPNSRAAIKAATIDAPPSGMLEPSLAFFGKPIDATICRALQFVYGVNTPRAPPVSGGVVNG